MVVVVDGQAPVDVLHDRPAAGAGAAPEDFEKYATPWPVRPPGCPAARWRTSPARVNGAGGGRAFARPPPSRHFSGHSFHARWYTVLMSPSVESIVMKLTLDGSFPAETLSSVLMLKLRCTPQGA